MLENSAPEIITESLDDAPSQQAPTNSLKAKTKSLLRKISFKPKAKTAKTQVKGKFKFKNLFNTKLKKAIWGIFLIILIILILFAILGIFTMTVAKELQTQTSEAQTAGQNAYLQFKNQNLPGAEAELKSLEGKLAQIKQTYDKLKIYKNLPILRNYYLDGEHAFNAAEAGVQAGLKTVGAISPYADVLGFSGQGSFEGGTAEDRVNLILQTLEKVTPELDQIQANLDTLNSELAQINANRYPQKLKNQEIRSKILEIKNMAEQANSLLSDYRPIIELMPSIAGATGERKKYLVLFQNDNELRPTGGFLTAYAVIYIENGKVTPEKSDDIYELDKKFTKKIAIPEALGKYLTTEKYFNLRDMNIYPDFKQSMDLFFEYYQNVPGEPDNIDGIIAVDTEFLTSLVEIVGPVEVPGYGTFTAENTPECDCPQIIYALSEIITRPTPYHRADRKGILAPLMQAILHKLYSSPRTYMADLFATGLESMEARHLQMYFFNEANQEAVEKINAAGRMESAAEGEDFLAIVNANLGGAKSNLFTDYKVTQIVSAPENGQITKTVEITYQNNRKADNCNLEAGLLCLNSTLRDWTRLYLPQGSELVEAQGFTQEPQVYDESGFTVLDGFFILEPMAQAKLKITYTVPYSADKYKIKLWKQGGISPVPVIMDITGGQEELLLDKDLVYETEF